MICGLKVSGNELDNLVLQCVFVCVVHLNGSLTYIPKQGTGHLLLAPPAEWQRSFANTDSSVVRRRQLFT